MRPKCFLGSRMITSVVQKSISTNASQGDFSLNSKVITHKSLQNVTEMFLRAFWSLTWFVLKSSKNSAQIIE